MTELATPGEAVSDVRRITLDVKGMACIACARHIQNKLNKIDGVSASVKYSTKIATIDANRDISVAELCDAVRAAGYDAKEHDAAEHSNSTVGSDYPLDSAEISPLRRLLVLLFRWLTLRPW